MTYAPDERRPPAASENAQHNDVEITKYPALLAYVQYLAKSDMNVPHEDWATFLDEIGNALAEAAHRPPAPTVDPEVELAARRWNALMRVGKIKMQGSSGINPHTLERNGNNVHFGAEFWPEPPKPEYADLDGGEHSTAWGKACLTALADAVLEREAAVEGVRP